MRRLKKILKARVESEALYRAYTQAYADAATYGVSAFYVQLPELTPLAVAIAEIYRDEARG